MPKNQPKGGIGEPVKVSGVKAEEKKPEPVATPPDVDQVEQSSTLAPVEQSEPLSNPLAELEKTKAELAAKEAELAERESRLKEEEKALRQMGDSLDEKIQANPQVEPVAGVLLSDLKVPDDIKAGADPEAPYELRRRYRDWRKKNHKGIATLKEYRVTVRGSIAGREGKSVNVMAVDESDARRQALKRMAVKHTEATTAKVEAV